MRLASLCKVMKTFHLQKCKKEWVISLNWCVVSSWMKQNIKIYANWSYNLMIKKLIIKLCCSLQCLFHTCLMKVSLKLRLILANLSMLSKCRLSSKILLGKWFFGLSVSKLKSRLFSLIWVNKLMYGIWIHRQKNILWRKLRKHLTKMKVNSTCKLLNCIKSTCQMFLRKIRGKDLLLILRMNVKELNSNLRTDMKSIFIRLELGSLKESLILDSKKYVVWRAVNFLVDKNSVLPLPVPWLKILDSWF